MDCATQRELWQELNSWLLRFPRKEFVSIYLPPRQPQLLDTNVNIISEIYLLIITATTYLI